MSGTFPTSPGPSSAQLDGDQPTFVDFSESAKSQSRISAGHLWKIKLSFPIMTRDQFAPIYAFIAKQRGRLESFQLSLPQFNEPQGAATGAPVLLAGTALDNNTLISTGWTPSVTNILKAGDLVKLADYSKVYMVAEDVNSDANGSCAITITGRIIHVSAPGVVITVHNVQFTVIADDGIQKWKTTAPALSSFSIDLTEKL